MMRLLGCYANSSTGKALFIIDKLIRNSINRYDKLPM